MRTYPLKAIYPDTELLVDQEAFFSSISFEFSRHYASGFFKKEDQEAIFIYQVIDGEHSHKGFVNNTAIEELENGHILAHEDTIGSKEQDMVQTTLEIKSIIKPILLFYDYSESIDLFLLKYIENKEPDYQCLVEEGVIHNIWKIIDEDQIREIQDLFSNEVKKAYIADGHHRVTTILKLYHHQNESFKDLDFSKVFTAYFSKDEIQVYDHIKKVDIFKEMKPEVFMAKLSKYAEIRHAKKFKRPKNKYEFVLLLNGEFYKCWWKKEILRNYAGKDHFLDPFIMQDIVFEKILKITDVRKDPRVGFESGKIEDETVLKSMVIKNNEMLIFQFPLNTSQIVEVAEKNIHLPPKSTWIEPRIKSGVIGQFY